MSLERFHSRKRQDCARNGRVEPLIGGCQIWGILNVTPDSFSDGGRFLAPDDALDHARAMLAQGADVIDVGGESSRPAGGVYGSGAERVTVDEESRRVVPVVRALVQELGVCVSIDTIKAEVARQAVDAGASIVNDVSCGASQDLVNVVAETGVQLVVMHTRKQGDLTGDNVQYQDVVGEVLSELLQSVSRIEASGVKADRIWIDPGIGFAKTAQQSIKLLARTDRFVATGYRVLVGPSRKSFVAEVAPNHDGQKPSTDKREGGTAAAVTAAVLGGASAIRVHDVESMRQVALVAESISSSLCSGRGENYRQKGEA
jgi:dihydropteroate synthase